MADGTASIQCRKCGTVITPDPKTRGDWCCPGCKARNPNLTRHYRSVADLCILGFIATIVSAVVSVVVSGVTLALWRQTMHAALLLMTITAVYRSKTPWTDVTVRILVWVTFGVACAVNLATLLLSSRPTGIGFLIVYAIIFPYLFWLEAQARKCAVATPPPAPRVDAGESGA